jgi:uncharacterized HAD superfamily protein
MNYRSIEDLNRSIVSNLGKVPRGTDLVVGIPRSGLLAANLLALHLNVPLADVDGFINGQLLQSGNRFKQHTKPFEEYKRVVFLDDSLYSGEALKAVKEKMKGRYPEKEIFYGAVFVVPGAVGMLDFYFDICKWPRLFEWNMMHHSSLENCCVDIDGVLCKDPTAEENDDGPNYESFLANAEPLLHTTATIGYLVTNRLEKYRPHTEAWLAKHNIKYKNLIMRDLPNKEARLKANDHGGFKASMYLKHDCWLFIESSEIQAWQIANITGKPVYCVDARKMIHPNVVRQTNGRVKQLLVRTLRMLSA